ncbi:MAG: 50S ribosomal protein L22 [Cytophagaceae bacterium]|jgi:large subunit ribosomal protein L22|nr:50S ribosomal protein L22 [Cytophagaceae bacterium]
METTKKIKKSVLKRQKKEAAKVAASKGPVQAKLNNVPTSTRKMRLVADIIRGKRVNEALGILKYQAKQGARKLEKLVLSAVADWQAKNTEIRVEDADLYVKEIFVDGGRVLKRLRTAPQGRAYRVRKRSNHVTIVVAALNAPTAAPVEVKTEAEEKSTQTKKASAKKSTASKSKAKEKAN